MTFTKRHVAAATALAIGAGIFAPGVAYGQSSPSPVFTYNFVPTAGQWNAYFQAKQDYLGYTPLPTSGGSLTGKIYTLPSTALYSGLNLGQGIAPSSPANGDVWISPSGMFAQVAGVTIGPFAVSTLSYLLPQGRLTLSSAVPVMTSTVSASANVYFTPYVGNQILLWNGAAFINTSFSQLTNVLANSSVGSAGPAAAVASSVYDLFAWNNAGTVTLTRGPAWTSVTSRSSGTAIAQVNGVYVNSVAITNGPGAGYGTYVGTVATDSSGATVTFNPAPAAASGGPTGGAWIGIWNYYNRVPFIATAKDSKASWTCVTGAADASANNRVTFVAGVPEDSISAHYRSNVTINAGSAAVGVGFDSNTIVGVSSPTTNPAATNLQLGVDGEYDAIEYSGVNYYQAVENYFSGTCTFNGSTYTQLSFSARF